MLEIMQESEGKGVGFRATGKLIPADYDQMLLPRLDRPAIRGLYWLVSRATADGYIACGQMMEGSTVRAAIGRTALRPHCSVRA